jgi:hypothetical protein
VVTDPVYCDTVAGVRSYDIGTRVNRPSGPGPVRHGPLRADSYVAVIERPNTIEPWPVTTPSRLPAPGFADDLQRVLASHRLPHSNTTEACTAPAAPR